IIPILEENNQRWRQLFSATKRVSLEEMVILISRLAWYLSPFLVWMSTMTSEWVALGSSFLGKGKTTLGLLISWYQL
ncbi:MAG: hypothetical protein KIT39_21340, partial [Nitrospirales bacterium]|nr:hypothetical protein [Nitrospirales bacterium]